MCLSPAKCAHNVTMLAAVATTGLNGLKADGIMGLSPSHQGTQADMMLEELTTQGVIQDKVFSFMVGQGMQESKVTFGGYDLNKYARGDIFWHDLKSTNYWTLHMTSAFLGTKQLHPTVQEVIIDSGTSFFLMPTGKS